MASSEKGGASNRQLLAGGVAGAIGTVVGQPLDSIKVWLQSHPVPSDGRWSIIKSHIQRDGFIALMDGVVPACWARFAIQALSFKFLSTFRSALHDVAPSAFPSADVLHAACVPAHTPAAAAAAAAAAAKSSSPSLSDRAHALFSPSPLHTTFAAGALAGVALTPLTSVLDLIKIQHQTATSLRVLDAKQAHVPTAQRSIPFLVDAVRRHGLRSLALGMAPTALRTTAFFGVYYTAYEATVAHYHGHAETGKTDVSNLRNSLVVLLGGSLAGGLGWLTILPVDYVKTRIQSQTLGAPRTYASAWQCFRQVYAQGGVAAFMRGGPAMVIRGVLVNAVVFYCYENILKGLEAIR